MAESSMCLLKSPRMLRLIKGWRQRARAKTGAGRQVIPDAGPAVWVQGREVVWKSYRKARRIHVRSNTKW